jgi:hypothetical protein
MGQEFIGRCSCGLEKTVGVGSSRSEHGKKFYFPHFCDSCNSLTTVNVLSKKYVCADCGGDSINTYAAKTKSLPYDSKLNSWSDKHLAKLGVHKKELVLEESYCFVLDKDFALFRTNNFCPSCKEYSLSFSLSAMYD